MNLEEQYHAEGMLRKIERVEAERDNAWTELREIREAISANPEESTLDEVVKLRQQLAASEQDRQDQIDLTIARAEEVKQLRQQLAEANLEFQIEINKVKTFKTNSPPHKKMPTPHGHRRTGLPSSWSA